MLSIPSRKQIEKIDQLTIAAGTSEDELIFRAVSRFQEWLIPKVSQDIPIYVLCGNGNNGADGFLLAKQLCDRGYRVTVLANMFSESRSNSNQHYFSIITEHPEIRTILIDGSNDLGKILGEGVLVDALFGNGLNRPLQGKYLNLVRQLNSHFEVIYALDVPSGLLPGGRETKEAMNCNESYSFEFPKQEFFAAENQKYVGKWDYGSIGLSNNAVTHQSINTFLIEADDVRSFLPVRSQFSHKGITGKVLHITNIGHMYGAAHMMIKACHASGCGLSYVHSITESHTPLPDESIYIDTLSEEEFTKFDVISIGPGLGTDDKATQVVDLILSSYSGPLVVDADALNVIASESWLNRLPERSILTPHIKEFSRLFGKNSSHSERIERQRQESLNTGIIIVLKGRFTSVSDTAGNIFYNKTGNPALARGGSGDVLTGVITSLRAQGMPAIQAAISGVHVHGLAADLYIQEEHESGMTIDQLISYLSRARFALS